jgi:hypothetical protein
MLAMNHKVAKYDQSCSRSVTDVPDPAKTLLFDGIPQNSGTTDFTTSLMSVWNTVG